MEMREKIYAVALAALGLLTGACGKKEASLEMDFPEKYEGKTVELINFEDSTAMAVTEVKDGHARFVLTDQELPVLATVNIDGRIRGYYIAEPGKATICDTLKAAVGTPLNDRFSEMFRQLDSVENLNDMGLYVDFAEKSYNATADTPLGCFFGVEWLKYADPGRVDSLLAKAPAHLRESKRARHYVEFARLRSVTAPGRQYVDFQGDNAQGKHLKFSSLVRPGKYTLVDFWASWCPYCIKEIPELKELYSDFNDKGLDIVGVAVRDSIADTRASVMKHDIPWTILYNTGRRPYDIYGFSGIPHLMLIGPDGKIVSRGESVAQIRRRLEESEQKGTQKP